MVWNLCIWECRASVSVTAGEDSTLSFLLGSDYRIQLQNAMPNNQTGTTTSLLSNPPISDDTKAFVAAIDSVPQDGEPTAADNLKALIQDCGVSPHKITELVQELPPRRFADVLIDFYFASV